MEHFVYQVIKASWGIVVSVSADFVPMNSFEGEFDRTSERFGVSGLDRMQPNEREAFLLGAEIVSSQIDECLRTKAPMILRLQKVEHNFSDFQVEGITCAAVGIIAQKFGFKPPEIKVEFDKSHNRYSFDFLVRT